MSSVIRHSHLDPQIRVEIPASGFVPNGTPKGAAKSAAAKSAAWDRDDIL